MDVPMSITKIGMNNLGFVLPFENRCRSNDLLGKHLARVQEYYHEREEKLVKFYKDHNKSPIQELGLLDKKWKKELTKSRDAFLKRVQKVKIPSGNVSLGIILKYKERGENFASMGFYESSIVEFRNAFVCSHHLNCNVLETRTILAEIMFSCQKFDDCFELLKYDSDLLCDEKSPEAIFMVRMYFLRGKLKHLKENYGGAIEDFEVCMKVDTSHCELEWKEKRECIVILAKSYSRVGEIEKFWDLRRDHGKLFASNTDLIVICSTMDDLEKSSERNPLMLSRLYFLSGNYEKAMEIHPMKTETDGESERLHYEDRLMYAKLCEEVANTMFIISNNLDEKTKKKKNEPEVKEEIGEDHGEGEVVKRTPSPPPIVQKNLDDCKIRSIDCYDSAITQYSNLMKSERFKIEPYFRLARIYEKLYEKNQDAEYLQKCYDVGSTFMKHLCKDGNPPGKLFPTERVQLFSLVFLRAKCGTTLGCEDSVKSFIQYVLMQLEKDVNKWKDFDERDLRKFEDLEETDPRYVGVYEAIVRLIRVLISSASHLMITSKFEEAAEEYKKAFKRANTLLSICGRFPHKAAYVMCLMGIAKMGQAQFGSASSLLEDALLIFPAIESRVYNYRSRCIIGDVFECASPNDQELCHSLNKMGELVNMRCVFCRFGKQDLEERIAAKSSRELSSLRETLEKEMMSRQGYQKFLKEKKFDERVLLNVSKYADQFGKKERKTIGDSMIKVFRKLCFHGEPTPKDEVFDFQGICFMWTRAFRGNTVRIDVYRHYVKVFACLLTKLTTIVPPTNRSKRKKPGLILAWNVLLDLKKKFWKRFEIEMKNDAEDIDFGSSDLIEYPNSITMAMLRKRTEVSWNSLYRKLCRLMANAFEKVSVADLRIEYEGEKPTAMLSNARSNSLARSDLDIQGRKNTAEEIFFRSKSLSKYVRTLMDRGVVKMDGGRIRKKKVFYGRRDICRYLSNIDQRYTFQNLNKEEKELHPAPKVKSNATGYGLTLIENKPGTFRLMMESSRNGSGKIEGNVRIYHAWSGYLIFEGKYKNGKRHGEGKEIIRSKNGTMKRVFNGEYDQNSRSEGAELEMENSSMSIFRTGWWDGNEFVGDEIKFDAPIVFMKSNFQRLKEITGGCIQGGQGKILVVSSDDVLRLRMKSTKVCLKLFHKATADFRKSDLSEASLSIDVVRLVRLARLIKAIQGKSWAVQILGVLANGGGYIMKYFRSRSVHDYIERAISHRQLNGELKKRLLILSAESVVQMHAANIAHRDLKWSNFLIELLGKKVDSGDGGMLVKLCDFDTAKQDLRSSSFRDSCSSISVETSGDTKKIGTLLYMAPEQTGIELPEEYRTSNNSTYDIKKADVYSYGIMMHLLLSENERLLEKKSPMRCQGMQGDSCGKKIEDGLSYINCVVNCCHRPSISEKMIECTPKKLIELMVKCWSQKPEDRPTMTEVVDVLKECDFPSSDRN